MSQPKESKNNVAKKGIKTMDKVVTGVILGGIIASIYGVKKIHDAKKDDDTPEHVEQPREEQKPGFWKRIFSRNSGKK